MKKTTLLFALSALFLLTAAIPFQADLKKRLNLVSHVAFMIRSSYVQETPDDKLIQGAMSGMMRTLDSYSQYLDPAAYKELKSDTQGKLAGVGIEISTKGGVLHVIAPVDGSPAAEAGILPGDVILKIYGASTKDFSLQEAVRLLRGSPGSRVTLTLLRDGQPAPWDVTIERRVIQVKGVREYKMLESGIGYVRIAEFQEQTATDFKNALIELRRQNAASVIIDLRNNPGGLLHAAVASAEYFLKKGSVIVRTKGRLKEKNREFFSTNTDPYTFKTVLVLVNKGSASAAEIFAGALQDYGLAAVAGKKTYGKGCVQTLTPLSDGSAVRITTSYYYTPKDRLIHEVGIQPDLELADNPMDPEDPALKAAVEWLKKH